jgi:hypothetical protein
MKETIVDEQFIREMNVLRQTPEGVGLFEACSSSVTLFSEYMLGIRLRAWQVYFLTKLQDAAEGKITSRKFLALTSRQVGKTLGVAIFALWCAAFNKYPGGKDNDTVIGMISASDEQAKKLLREVKKRIRAGDFFMRSYKNPDGSMMFPPRKVGGKEVGFFTALTDENEPNNTTTITFKSYDTKYGVLLKDSKLGSSIMSYPPTPIVLGKTFTVCFIDEAGLSERISDKFYEELAPTFDEYDAIVVFTSTPWQPSGFFYEIADPDGVNADMGVEKVLFTIDCIKIEEPDRYSRTIEEIARLNAAGKLDHVQRSYYCRFVKGEQSYFDPIDVDDVFSEEYPPLESYKGECDMGIDYGGQVKSRTVITITRLEENGTVRRLFHKVYSVQKDLNILSDVEQLLKDFNVQRIIPDDCPQGDYFNRIMVEERGWNIHLMNFRSEKVKKYGAFRVAVKRGRVKSYEDPELRTEMKALEFSQGNKQSNIQASPGYNDDLIDSFVMSAYFMVQDEDKFNFYDLDDHEEIVVQATPKRRWWKE